MWKSNRFLSDNKSWYGGSTYGIVSKLLTTSMKVVLKEDGGKGSEIA